MTEDLHAQVAHHALPEQTGEHRLGIRKPELRNNGQRQEQSATGDQAGISRRERNVNDEPRQQRTNQLKCRVGAQRRQRGRREAPVRPEVSEEPAHQGTIVRLAERLFFVHRGWVGHRTGMLPTAMSPVNDLHAVVWYAGCITGKRGGMSLSIR